MNLFISHFKKLFILKIGFLITLIFTFLISSELLIRNIIVYKDPFNSSIELFWNNKNDTTSGSAIFGSSEIARGLLINNKKIYNLALGGEHLALTKAKVESFIKNKKKIDLILLPATATTLNRSYEDVKNDDRIKFFSKNEKPYIFLSMKYHRNYTLNYWSKFLIEKDFFSTVKLLKYGGQVRTERDSFRPYYERSDKEKGKMVSMTYLENYEFIYSNKEKSPGFIIYDELINRIIQKGGKVCLIHMPYVEKYSQIIKQNKWLNYEMPNIWKSLERKYQHKVKFLNLSTYIKNDKYFRDVTHLTREGGEKYGKKILNMCLQELL